MEKGKPAAVGEGRGATGSSRRCALGVMLGACGWLPKALADAGAAAPIRLAISESLVSDVNINDARAAMITWLKRMEVDLNLVIEFSPKVFDTTDEILRRARTGQFDAVALNIVEYRQIADMLDPSQIIAEGGAEGLEQYVLLVRQNGGAGHLSELRGRRLTVLQAPKMCVATAWLSTLLEQGNLGPADRFFGSVATDNKPSRVVLPVFFGQADACVTSRRSFDLMGELNPQVARNLTAIAASPALTATFYTFHKNYRGANRERFAKIYSNMPASAAGRQLATLFQFQGLAVRDATCLASALAILEAADRGRARQGAGGRK
jgi:phosphonate transport system substrate-binding protein